MEPGTVLAGRYRLDKRLGAGGMGEVWQAQDLTYERGLGVPLDVAVKVVHSTLGSEALLRFEQEAEILRKLEHPGIVRMLDTDFHQGQLFIVMELLADQDLGNLLAREGRLEVRRTVELMRQAATGLSAVHAAGIVHRDLKPANLFVRPGGVGRPGDLLKIGDFGLARVSNKPGIVTTQGVIVGTWAYIAPERWLGTWHGEPGADLYSLGCVLYELLTGKTPFPADSMAVIKMHCEEIPQPLRSGSQEIPAPLNDLVLRLLEKDPRMRYEGAAAVADALARIRDDLAPLAGQWNVRCCHTVNPAEVGTYRPSERSLDGPVLGERTGHAASPGADRARRRTPYRPARAAAACTMTAATAAGCET